MRDFSSVRRIVIKAGTNILSSPSGIDNERIDQIASEVSRLREMGKQVLIVSSGAVGLGAKALGHTSPVVYIGCTAFSPSSTAQRSFIKASVSINAKKHREKQTP